MNNYSFAVSFLRIIGDMKHKLKLDFKIIK